MNILLADDHCMFRESLRALLARNGYDVVGEASEGSEAVRVAVHLSPDIALLDLSMPLLNGIEAAREIRRRVPKTHVIMLTMFEEDIYVLAALQAGVRGYVLKVQAAEDLVKAIQQVARGAIYLSPGVSQVVVDAYLTKRQLGDDPLTHRERQVLRLIAEGKSTKGVAAVLGLSVKTAETHRTRIMQKLKVHNTVGLVRYAIRCGLIRP